MRILIILLSFTFFPMKSFAKDMATWGIIGTKCSQTISAVNRFGQNGRDALSFSVQGFLTGYNSHVMLMDLQKKIREKARVVNKYSLPDITNMVLSRCRSNPNKATYVVLIEIWRTLPIARY